MDRRDNTNHRIIGTGDVPKLTLRVEFGLPLSLAVASTKQSLVLVLHSIRRFCYTRRWHLLAYSIHYTEADSQPSAGVYLITLRPFAISTAKRDSGLRLPQLRCFCGKSYYFEVNLFVPTFEWVINQFHHKCSCLFRQPCPQFMRG